MSPTRRWLLAAALLAMLCSCQQLPEAASVSCGLAARGESLGTSDRIDFAFFDRGRHRIYVARDGGIDVWNAHSGAPVGRIRDINGTIGIVMAPSLKRGFAADSTTGAIMIFDLDSLEVIGRIPNTNSPNGMVFDAATGTVVGDVPRAGSPNALWSRGSGMLYLRIKRPARVVRVNLDARRVDARWLWTACNGPRDLAWR